MVDHYKISISVCLNFLVLSGFPVIILFTILVFQVSIHIYHLIMSHFKILRVDHYDPEILGRRNRLLYTIYGVIPMLFITAFNLATIGTMSDALKYLISLPVLILFSVLLLRKVRKNNNLDTIGEIEITQSGLKKKVGDSITDYRFQSVRELTMTKHMPATRLKESKSGYFSYILKIEFNDGHEETLVVSDRSVDYNHRLSVLDTIKTLKKIVPFNVQINI